jgi:hypothetical protein
LTGSVRRPRPRPATAGGSVAQLAAALAFGTLAFLLVPAAPALVGESFLPRGILTGGIVGLTCRRESPLIAGAATALVAALLGELVFALVPMPFLLTRTLITLILCVGSAVGAMLLARRGRTSGAALGLLLVALVAHLWISGALPGIYRGSTDRLLSTLRHEPVAGRYDFDGDIYLRTYFMMKRGEPFYPSFATACAEDARELGAPRGKLNYREPFLFELWRRLPGRDGVDLRNWFLAFVAVVMVCGYHLARTFVGAGPALLAPLTLGGYFATAAWSGWFLFAEFWAGGVAVMAALALVRGRWLTGAILIAVAVAFRELMVYLVPAFVAGWALCRRPRPRWTALAAGLTLPVLPLALHLVAAPSAPGAPAFDLSAWLHGGFGQLVETLRFSSNFVPLGPSLLPWAPVPALVGAALVRPGWRAGFLLTALGLAVLGLFSFSAGRYGLYWGAILQPLALAVAPLAASRMVPAES